MGLGISAIQNFLELYNLGYLKNSNSVLDIGSQELHCTKNDVKILFEQAGLDSKIVDKYPNVDNWPNKPRCSAKYFYNSLGLESYNCIDINDQFNSINHDLNLPYNDNSKFNKYDVVTDYGSCEHVFNISECYKTVHNLTKPGGFIIIAQGTYKGNGYFLFDKSFFDGIAAANNYKVIYSSYIVMPGTKTQDGSSHQFHIPQSEYLFNTLNINMLSNVAIYNVMQKTSKDEFKIPYQHDFMNKYYNIAGFNRVYHKDPLSFSYLRSSKVSHDKIPFKTLLKIFIKRLSKKFYK